MMENKHGIYPTKFIESDRREEMLIAQKDIGDVTHRLTYYPDEDGMQCLSSEYPEEYSFTSVSKQLWRMFVEGNAAWGHREHLRWAPEPVDSNNDNQVHYSDFVDLWKEVEKHQKSLFVDDLRDNA